MIIKIPISFDGEILIKPGQKVDFNDPLTKKQATEEVKVPLASILKISPSAIFKSLKKFVGDAIKKGELIAEHKGLLSTKTYVSEHDGLIKEINHNDGSLLIEVESGTSNTVLAFFKGEVNAVEDGEVHLKIGNYKEYKLDKADDDFGGETVIIAEQKLIELTADEVENKVLITEKVLPYEQIKLETLGVKGIVTVQPVEQTSEKPASVLKENDDWEKIQKQEFPYCIISKKNNTIYFYA